MTTKPTRYVRVRLYSRGLDMWPDRWQYTCLCRQYLGFGSDSSEVHDRARDHARTCPAVRAAMERDQLRAEVTRLRASRDELRDRIQALVTQLNEALEGSADR